MTLPRGFNVRRSRILISCLFMLTTFSACSRPESSEVPVSIHAVNYSDQELQYFLQDPKNASNRGGGEEINRYAAGGTMCCYTLPKKWQPGLQVKIHYELYFAGQSGGSNHKKTGSTVIDIPQYVTPEELWVVREKNGAMSIILSNFQPDHPDWPGKIKGWPIPSLAVKSRLVINAFDE